MKKCGIIGGMSWESTLTYYKVINEEINKRLGGLHSGRIVIDSLDFEEIVKYQKESNWEKTGEILAKSALNLQKAGADFVLIATNTMHKNADDVQKAIDIPLLDIRDVTIKAIKESNIDSVLLLGTKFTMEDNFFKDKLIKEGIKVYIPEEREFIHKVIFNELCLGIIKNDSKKIFIDIIENSPAKGVILGCTEIGMLIQQKDVTKKVFDTTIIHANAAVDNMLN